MAVLELYQVRRLSKSDLLIMNLLNTFSTPGTKIRYFYPFNGLAVLSNNPLSTENESPVGCAVTSSLHQRTPLFRAS